MQQDRQHSMSSATLANGCFWCTEAVFRRLKGVSSVMPGYTGGTVPNPSYQQVCDGTTGHAEALRIEFDPNVISYEKLLDVFWATHDPTTLNRQGNDVGTQYRSAIFYHDEEQKHIAEQSKQRLADSGKFHDPIVTEIKPVVDFFPADESHRAYYEKNREAGYCRLVIDPKITKLYKEFHDQVKESA